MPIYSYTTFLTSVALAVGAVGGLALPGWGQVRGFHYLNDVQGDVRVGQSMIAPDPASEGMVLQSTHSRIRLRENSQVTLNCSNDTRHRLSDPGTYAVADYCPGAISRRNGRPNNPSRDSLNTALPYLISPRNTALIAPANLLLEWNPVLGSTAYTLQIEGRGVNFEVEVDEPKARFPDVDSLQPNYRYTVVITADSGLSSQNGLSVGFTVLPAAEVERVHEAVEQIQSEGLEPDIEAIALAMLYLDYEHSDPDWRSYALNQSALEVLAVRSRAGTENPEIYLLQAEAYWASGLPLLARGSYERALALGQTLEQREIQAMGHVGLGEIAAGQTDYQGAIAHLRVAQTLYEELGDCEQVEVLQARIETLKEEL